jgi:hypothetical protein
VRIVVGRGRNSSAMRRDSPSARHVSAKRERQSVDEVASDDRHHRARLVDHRQCALPDRCELRAQSSAASELQNEGRLARRSPPTCRERSRILPFRLASHIPVRYLYLVTTRNSASNAVSSS